MLVYLHPPPPSSVHFSLFLITSLLFLLITRTTAQQQQCKCLSSTGCPSPTSDNAVVGGTCWAMNDGILQRDECTQDCCVVCSQEQVFGGERCLGFNGGLCNGGDEGRQEQNSPSPSISMIPGASISPMFTSNPTPSTFSAVLSSSPMLMPIFSSLPQLSPSPEQPVPSASAVQSIAAQQPSTPLPSQTIIPDGVTASPTPSISATVQGIADETLSPGESNEVLPSSTSEDGEDVVVIASPEDAMTTVTPEEAIMTATPDSDTSEGADLIEATVEPTPDMKPPNSSPGGSSDGKRKIEAFEMVMRVKTQRGLSIGLNNEIKEIVSEITNTSVNKWSLTEILEVNMDNRVNNSNEGIMLRQVEVKYVVVFNEGETNGLNRLLGLIQWVGNGNMARELKTRGFDNVQIEVRGEPTRLRIEGQENNNSGGSGGNEEGVEKASGLNTPVIVAVTLGVLVGAGILVVLAIMFWNGGTGNRLRNRFGSNRSDESNNQVSESDLEDIEDGLDDRSNDFEGGDNHDGGGRRETDITNRTYNVSDVDGGADRKDTPRGPTVLMRESSIMEWQESTSVIANVSSGEGGNMGNEGYNNGSNGWINHSRNLTEETPSSVENVLAENGYSLGSHSSTSDSYSGIKVLDPEEDDLYLQGAVGHDDGKER